MQVSTGQKIKLDGSYVVFGSEDSADQYFLNTHNI